MPRPPRLFTVGSVVVDLSLRVAHLPQRGGDVLASAARMSAGGGFNILAAAARQGLACIFAGRHGTGPYGDQIRADFAREGIAAALPPVTAGDSGFCLVMVEPDGERSFVSSPGVEAELGARRFDDMLLGAGDTLFASGYDLAYAELGPAIAGWAEGLPHGVRVVFDPGPLVAEIPQSVLARALGRADVWTMNRREAALLTGTPEPEAASARVRARLRPEALLILRDGAAGAWVSVGSDLPPRLLPAPPVPMIDSTGAGDTHTGVLIAALAEGLGPIAAVTRANAAAALSVTRRGPATAPTRQALDAFLAETDCNHNRREEV